VIILDTNVISALMRETSDVKVRAWLDRQPHTSIWTSAITVLEVRFGLQVMPAGRRRTFLLQGFDVLLTEIGNRVVAFDDEAAEQAADLMASRQKKGRSIDLRDTLIAGIVLAHHATLATRNTAHFEDIPGVVNPWLV